MRFYTIAWLCLFVIIGVGCSPAKSNLVVGETQEPSPTAIEPTEIPASPTPDKLQGRLTHNPETRTGIAEIDRVIDVVLKGDPPELLAIMHFLSTGCTTQDGLGGPPRCEAGQAEGSLVSVFPFLGPEGHFLRQTDAAEWQGLSVSGLYAVYRVSESVYSDPNYPAGEYGIIFLADDDFTDYTFNVTGGMVVRIDNGFGEIPQIDFEKVATEIILSPPVE